MELDQAIQVAIRLETVFPTGPAFGVACLACVHAEWPERLRAFSSLKEVADACTTANETVTTPYLMAQKHLSLNPSVTKFLIGKRANSYTQVVKLTIKVATAGYVYKFNVIEDDGTVTPITRTVPGSSTTTAEATAIAALITAILSGNAAASSAVITTTMTVGRFVRFTGLPDPSVISFEDTTADPGIVADLQALEDASALDDSLSFFAWAFDRTGKAESVAAQAHVEATKRVALYQTIDTTTVGDSNVTTDVGSTLKDSLYRQCAVIAGLGDDFRTSAILGLILPLPVGSWSLAWKGLPGIVVDKMLSGIASTIEGKNVSTYRKIGSGPAVWEGKVPDGNFLDTIMGQLHLESDLKIAVYGEEVTRKKIPFTDAGIAILANRCTAVLHDYTAQGPDDLKLLAASPAPTVTPPKAADISSANKAARLLDPGIKFTATLAGAIHRAKIEGTIGV